ncbi:neoverrucotoxin subunit alpha-like isoform X2 [Xyrichtys novacula]|uniref:Neoverrucotoxin subunit alpha-like isoform X2 n=1 Tax=Xyrichtys novacula TaxID=13765 RepID=A0AAV1H9M1_XYRNO|nr:neoverrucotoxin subunit alpha-like isoform X2 [Xyrichtys novacula]
MTSEHRQVAALGRPLTLGMLYDARKDELIPGLTLWDEKTLEEKNVETPQPSSSYEISTSDSIESKSSMLKVSASLQASFMGGLFSVSGSAEYMKDTKHSQNQSRVTFQNITTTTFKQLSMIDMITLNEKQTELIKKGTATHVVTGIVYGANCFFVFDSEKVDSSEVQDISGKMKAMLNKIPEFDFQAEAEVKLTAEEKKLTNQFSCKFYGDLLLKSNPATFMEAVQTYKDLPNLLGKNNENCVPQTVWLMPLTDLDSKAVTVKSALSQALVRKMQDTLEGLRKVEMRCNDALADMVVQSFPPIQKKVQRFKNLCEDYEDDIRKTFAEKLLHVREGKEDEGALMKVFQIRENSPFSSEQFNKWMDDKEREINVVRSCLDILKGVKILPNKSELDKVILDTQVEIKLCYAFTSLESPDPSLDAMTSFLASGETQSTEEVPWFYSDDVLQEMRKLAVDAMTVTSGDNNILFISAIPNEEHKGVYLYTYKNSIPYKKEGITEYQNVTYRAELFSYWTAGSLSFYNLVGSKSKHLYTFYTKFSEPVYPAFAVVKDSNYVELKL